MLDQWFLTITNYYTSASRIWHSFFVFCFFFLAKLFMFMHTYLCEFLHLISMHYKLCLVFFRGRAPAAILMQVWVMMLDRQTLLSKGFGFQCNCLRCLSRD